MTIPANPMGSNPLLFVDASGRSQFVHDTNGEYFLGLGLVENNVDLVEYSQQHPSPSYRSIIKFAVGSSDLDAYLEGIVRRYYECRANNSENDVGEKLIEIAADCLVSEGNEDDIKRHQDLGEILLDNILLIPYFGETEDIRINLFSKIAYGNQVCIDRLKQEVYPRKLQWYPDRRSPEHNLLRALVQITNNDEDFLSYLRSNIDTRKTGNEHPLRNTLTALMYSKSKNGVGLLKEILNGDYGDLLFYTEHFFYVSTLFNDAFEVLCHVDLEQAKAIAKQCLTVGYAGKDKDHYNHPSFWGYNLLTHVASLGDSTTTYERPSPARLFDSRV